MVGDMLGVKLREQEIILKNDKKIVADIQTQEQYTSFGEIFGMEISNDINRVTGTTFEALFQKTRELRQ